MRTASSKFTDFSPQGREVFRQAVESEKRLIRERGYVEFTDDNGRQQRIKIPVMPTVTCAAFECPNIVIGKAVYCFTHEHQRRVEFGGGR